MSEWLQTYNEMFGMYHAGIITTIFGAFAVTFTVLMSWPKLVKDFGPIGGFMAAALIIGTFWLVNHLYRIAERCRRLADAVQPDPSGESWQCPLGRHGLGDCDGIHLCRRALRTERYTRRIAEGSVSTLGSYYTGRHCRRNLRRPYRIHECGTLIQLTEKENIKCIY